MEKAVSKQLSEYLNINNLHDPLQSAYKQGTSTETALLFIKSEMDNILDSGDAVLVVLLDLSATFHTIDSYFTAWKTTSASKILLSNG
jgi:hypothetical protein